MEDLHLSTSNKMMDFEMHFRLVKLVLLHEADHILLPQTVSIGPVNGLNPRRKLLSMVKQII